MWYPEWFNGFSIEISTGHPEWERYRLVGSDAPSIPDRPICTVRPFRQESIRFMMRGGREGLEVMEMGTLSTEMGILLEGAEC